MNAILIIGGSVLLGILLALPIMYASRKQLEQLQRYWNVEIGMPEEEMLDIMGEGYNRSFLKNNRVKYEWRINATSVGSSYKGTSFRSYSGVKKVTIYTKNGFVEEVKPYNVYVKRHHPIKGSAFSHFRLVLKF